LIPDRFAYTRPASVEEALGALADPEAKALAGGHSLLPLMKLRLARPSLLVDIGRLDLRGVSEIDGTVAIGPLTTYAELLGPGGAMVPDALREAAAAVGDLQVRNLGTIGGALAHGDPASDIAAAVLALSARLRLRSATGIRECPVREFFRAPFTTALRQQELLVEIALPSSSSAEGSAYRSIKDPASGYPLAGAAVRVRLDDERVTECAVGLTGAAPVPCRVPVVEAALVRASADSAAEAARDALASVQLMASAGSEHYTRQLALVAIARAVESALSRAGERGHP
jgi:carbon-monoxide dehydrogenase medium subunit